MIGRVLILFLAVITAPFSSQARETLDRVAAIEAAWRGWMTDVGAQTGSLAVMKDGAVVLEVGAGLRDSGDPVVLASLSKAVSAMCLDAILQKHRLGYDTTLEELAPRLEAVGMRVRDRIATITIGQLITQQSGLTRDVTQGTFNGVRNAEFARNVGYANAAGKASHGRRAGKFTYNNGNYALLGAVTEALEKRSQEEACQLALFQPNGITTARLNPEWRALGAFGGWEMSVADYLRFVEAFFAPGTPYGDAPKKRPHAPVANSAYYGLGVFFRVQSGRATFWHTGRICTDGRHTDRGAFFARLSNGWSYAAAYDFCAAGNEDWDLDNLLFRAATAP